MTQTLHSRVWQFSCLTTCPRFFFSAPFCCCFAPSLALASFCEACGYAHRCPSLPLMKALHSLPLYPVCSCWVARLSKPTNNRLPNSIGVPEKQRKMFFSISTSPMSHAICQCMSHNILNILILKMIDCLSEIQIN